MREEKEQEKGSKQDVTYHTNSLKDSIGYRFPLSRPQLFQLEPWDHLPARPQQAAIQGPVLLE